MTFRIPRRDLWHMWQRWAGAPHWRSPVDQAVCITPRPLAHTPRPRAEGSTDGTSRRSVFRAPRARHHETRLPEVLGGDERRPVSYTHLRAHETVLDLVCRLL